MTTYCLPGSAKPFAIMNPLSCLREPYPPLEQIYVLGNKAERRYREIFVRLWLTEGIPFAFRECPAVYEDLRGWLGERLGIHPKQVTLVGSGRLGISLGGRNSLGRAFGPESDLDFAIVSSELFRDIRIEFEKWATDYKESVVRPSKDRERNLWNSNLKFGRNNIPKGFMDANKIPVFRRYYLAQKIGQTMWVLVEKLKRTQSAPKPEYASIRIYDRWESLVTRVSFNLSWVLSYRAT